MPTYSSALLPSTSGLSLGSSSLRWSGYFTDINVSGAITLANPLLSPEFFNVKTYGAAGDGIIDDTAAISATIAAALATSYSRTIYFPAGKYKVTSTLAILTRGMTFIGTRGERPETSGGSSIEYSGTGECIKLGAEKVATITAIVRSGNVVTATLSALPSGAGTWLNGHSVTVAGCSDATFNGTFTLTAVTTQASLQWAQVAANASSSGGTVTEAIDANSYDGIQDFTMQDMELRYSGAGMSALQNGQGNFGTGTYGIRDWRGGDVKLYRCTFENFAYGFWGIQSDINIFRDCRFSYNSVGMYLGPRSDQFNLDSYYGFLNDTALQFDGVQGARVSKSQFVADGSATTYPIVIGSPSSTRGSVGLSFEDDWFEHLQGFNGVINNFVDISRGDANQSYDISFVRPVIQVAPQANPLRTTYFATVDNATGIQFEKPHGSQNNLAALVQTIGTTNPVISTDQLSRSGFTLLVNSGSGVPKIYKMDWTAIGFPVLRSGANLSMTFGVNSGDAADGSVTAVNFNLMQRAVNKWVLQSDASSVFRILDSADSSKNRLAFATAGNTQFNAGGSGSISLNGTSGSGTGGVSGGDGAGATTWTVSSAGKATFNGGIISAAATPTVAASQLGLGSTVGFGTGAAGTAVTTTTKGGGTGPTTPQTVVNHLKVNIGGTDYYVPLVQ